MSDDLTKYPKNRAEAEAVGSSFFFSGSPCSGAGHVGLRYTTTGGCCACAKDRSKARHARKMAEQGPKPRKPARPLKDLPSRSVEAQRKYKARYMERVRADPARLEEHRRSTRERMLRRYHGDAAIRIKNAFSNRIRYAIGKGGKTTRQILRDYCGYTIGQLMEHLERQFNNGMTWQNYGSVWHIDHITPVSAFDVRTLGDDEFRACWSLGNLRPLLIAENLRKKDNLIFLV